MDTTAGRKLIRCEVICASCGIPAGRKLCGFLLDILLIMAAHNVNKAFLAVLVRWITLVFNRIN